MPKVAAQRKTFDVSVDANLRESLLEHDIDLYNGTVKVLNFHGHRTMA